MIRFFGFTLCFYRKTHEDADIFIRLSHKLLFFLTNQRSVSKLSCPIRGLQSGSVSYERRCKAL
jgi:hypothetical protein